MLIPLDENGFNTGMFSTNDLRLHPKSWTVSGDGMKLLDDNKIQEFSADDLELCYDVEYVEDAPARARLLMLQHKEAEKAWDAYTAACNAFNRLAPDGIEHLNPYSAPRHYIM